MEELFFENYVPISEDEKKEIGEEFEKLLREIGISNIKDIPKKQFTKVNRDVWRIK